MPLKLNPITGQLDLVSINTGFVKGPPVSTDKAIARWSGTTGDQINDSLTQVQDSGAIEAQGFISKRTVSGTVSVSSDESWISPSLEMTPGAVIVLAAGAQLIIV